MASVAESGGLGGSPMAMASVLTGRSPVALASVVAMAYRPRWPSDGADGLAILRHRPVASGRRPWPRDSLGLRAHCPPAHGLECQGIGAVAYGGITREMGVKREKKGVERA